MVVMHNGIWFWRQYVSMHNVFNKAQDDQRIHILLMISVTILMGMSILLFLFYLLIVQLYSIFIVCILWIHL